MIWEDDIQAWVSSSLSDCFCPSCSSPLSQGWQQCDCGELLNVERISSHGTDTWIVTREQDEMQELVDRLDKKKENYQTYLV